MCALGAVCAGAGTPVPAGAPRARATARDVVCSGTARIRETLFAAKFSRTLFFKYRDQTCLLRRGVGVVKSLGRFACGPVGLESNTKSHPTDLTSALIPAGILVARDLSKSLRAPRSFLLALPAAPSDLCLAE